MARKKRLALALPDDADQVLTEIAEILDKPKTTIVTEIFLEALPTLQIVAKMLAEAKTGTTDSAVLAMAKALKEAGIQLNQAQFDFSMLQIENGKKGRNDV